MDELTAIDDLTVEMEFGKYKGVTLAYILRHNASYLLWADRTVDRFKLSGRLRKIAERAACGQSLERAGLLAMAGDNRSPDGCAPSGWDDFCEADFQ